MSLLILSLYGQILIPGVLYHLVFIVYKALESLISYHLCHVEQSHGLFPVLFNLLH